MKTAHSWLEEERELEDVGQNAINHKWGNAQVEFLS